MKLASLMRRTILAAAGVPWVSRTVRACGLRLGASRFVAAETLEETVPKIRRLNEQGLLVTLDYLGESVQDRELAKAAAVMVLRMLEQIHDCRLNCHVSVKLTQLGLTLDESLCRELMVTIVEAAKEYGNFVRIDMEDSSVTGRTIKLFKELLSIFGPEAVGLVLQAYLYRSAADAEELGRLGANIRFVKGAYLEPPQIAFPRKADVNANYLRLVQGHMKRGAYTAVATHDPRMIEAVKRFAREQQMPNDRFEFQMLYGIAEGLQGELVRQGYRVRVYTPFGREWYPYFTRRIAERPANLGFLLKNLLRR